MGHYFYPAAPGTKYGPCKDDCQHKDCKTMRADAEQICRICGKPIGYDNAVIFEEVTLKDMPGSARLKERRIVHAHCGYEEAESGIEIEHS